MDWTVAAEYAYNNGFADGYLKGKEDSKLLQWKDVKKELPDDWEEVLCYYPDKNFGSNYVIDCYDTQGFILENKYGKCTFWSKLPVEPVSVNK